MKEKAQETQQQHNLEIPEEYLTSCIFLIIFLGVYIFITYIFPSCHFQPNILTASPFLLKDSSWSLEQPDQ